MAKSGVSRAPIKLHGRWRSDAVEAYLQPSLATRLSVVSGVQHESLGCSVRDKTSIPGTGCGVS